MDKPVTSLTLRDMSSHIATIITDHEHGHSVVVRDEAGTEVARKAITFPIGPHAAHALAVLGWEITSVDTATASYGVERMLRGEILWWCDRYRLSADSTVFEKALDAIESAVTEHPETAGVIARALGIEGNED